MENEDVVGTAQTGDAPTTPFAKSNGQFFPDTKINMMPSSNLYDFDGCIQCMQVVIFRIKYIDFLH